MQKNVDYVLYEAGNIHSWTFTIAGKAQKISEEYEEILDIARCVINICKGFFIPTSIKFNVLICNEDYKANNVFEGTCSIHSKVDIKSDKGIKFSNVIEAVKNVKIPDKIRCIRRVEIEQGKLKLYLKNNEVFIDKTSSDEIYKTGFPPKLAPFEIYITHYPYKMLVKGKDKETVSTAYYKIDFWTYIDIWFEKNELGMLNRKNLRQALKKIYDNYEVVSNYFASESFSEKDVKDVIFGND